jgi:hypothetical protein
MMTCQEVQTVFSPYLDDKLVPETRTTVDQHFKACPVCRAQFSAMQTLVRDLGSVVRPAPPIELVSSITTTLRIEAAARRRKPVVPFSVVAIKWLRPRLMPYTVGAFASLIFFMVMFAGLRSSLLAFHDWDVAEKQAQDSVAFLPYARYDITRPISAEIYAAGRAPFSIDSPSLNPRGALAAFTRSALQGNENDDMVVVTDVFSNGIASLAEVMQAPRDRRLLEDFQDALRQDAAFVPASFDRRPQTMRVVFVIQKVDVRERQF